MTRGTNNDTAVNAWMECWRSFAAQLACLGGGVSLQVVNLDYLTVSAYTDRLVPGQPAGSLVRLETRLDTMEFPAGAVIPGRTLLLQDPAYGGTIPHRVSVLPTTREQAWTTFVGRDPVTQSHLWSKATWRHGRKPGLWAPIPRAP
jgi:hypothetical protein